MLIKYLMAGIIFASALWLFAGCGTSNITHPTPIATAEVLSPLQPTLEVEQMELLLVDQNAVGSIEDWRIGVSNIWDRDYIDAEGNSRTGITAQFTLWQKGTDPQAVTRTIVYTGALFQLGDHQYRVVEVRGGSGSNAQVVIDPHPITP